MLAFIFIPFNGYYEEHCQKNKTTMTYEQKMTQFYES